MLKLIFDVDHPGEYSAGIRSFNDQVTIEVAGDPGGEHGEFEDHMRQALTDWFDGARVKRHKEDGARINPDWHDCPRCGIGNDSNGDGDCLVCHSYTDEQIRQIRQVRVPAPFGSRKP